MHNLLKNSKQAKYHNCILITMKTATVNHRANYIRNLMIVLAVVAFWNPVCIPDSSKQKMEPRSECQRSKSQMTRGLFPKSKTSNKKKYKFKKTNRKKINNEKLVLEIHSLVSGELLQIGGDRY